MKLSIIIPSNVLDRSFERCLRSVQQASITAEFELIIVLDGVPALSEFFNQFTLPNVTVIELLDNKGPAFARNRGAEAARGDLLFFMDADVTLHSSTINRIKSHFVDNDAPDAVIGSYDDEPEYPSMVSKFRNLLHHYTHQQASVNATTFWSACGAIRKDVFLSLSGFDESYTKPSIEDIELGYRLIESGGRIVLDKDCHIKHLKQWTLLSMVHTDVVRRALPWAKLLRHFTRIEHNDLNLKRKEKVIASLVGLMCLCLFSALLINPLFFVAALVITILLLALNGEFYAYLRSRLPASWMPAMVLLHWLYYTSAMTGFLVGTMSFLFEAAKQTKLNRDLRSYTE